MKTTRICAPSRILLTAAAVAGMASAIMPGASAHAAEGACARMLTPVYRLTNPTTATSLLTPWVSEIDSARGYGYTRVDTEVMRAALSEAIGLVPVQRLFDPKKADFAFSANAADAAVLTGSGYTVSGNKFYASATPLSCTVPYSRAVKAGVHRTVAANEVPGLVAQGWTDEGVLFHAIPGPNPTQVGTPPAAQDADGKFSIAVYPDTQEEVLRPVDTRLSNRNAYVVAQKDVRDIRYVTHVGDVVDFDTATAEKPNDHIQYDTASREMRNLEASGIKWAPALGNHDTYAVGPTSGAARPGVQTWLAVRDTKTFNATFPAARQGGITGVFESGKVDNAYRNFDAAGKKWAILNLELWARPEAIAWAKSVIEGNADRNFILVTHSYLNSDGSIGTSNGGYGATSPTYLYDNLVRLYANIKLVLSGHVTGTAVRTDIGMHGNKIVSMLTCFHSATTNEVRFLEFDVVNSSIKSTGYAPWTSADVKSLDVTVTGMSWR